MGGSHMEADGRSSQLGVFRCPTIRILNHQMHVDRQIGHLTDTGHNRLAKRQIRNEMMIHHIHMDEIRIGDCLEITFQVAEIGGQNARCDLNSHGSHSMEGNRLELVDVGVVIGMWNVLRVIVRKFIHDWL